MQGQYPITFDGLFNDHHSYSLNPPLVSPFYTNKMTGFISLCNLRFHAFHGVLPQERRVGNDYRVSLRIAYPIERAMQSDRVEDTLSYADVYEEVKEVMKTPSQLLENVAYRIGRQLFKAFPYIESLEIKVTKINPPMATDGGEAAVELQLINDKTR